jgi:hypothetical protein
MAHTRTVPLPKPEQSTNCSKQCYLCPVLIQSHTYLEQIQIYRSISYLSNSCVLPHLHRGNCDHGVNLNKPGGMWHLPLH